MNFEELHHAVLNLMESLIDLNPDAGTPEFNLLKNLAEAVDQYERGKGMRRLSHD